MLYYGTYIIARIEAFIGGIIMQHGVITLGEALIDFIPTDYSNTTYIKSPGGAPANVAVGVARLGERSTFLGKVGDDVLGKFLKETLRAHHVHTDQLSFTADHRTGLVFVTNDVDGERNFDFYINPSADHFLQKADIDTKNVISHKILHFGSISLIRQPAKEATEHAVKLARENRMVISFDPNLRLTLWEKEEDARTTIISMLDQVDILKLSEEELTFLTGKQFIKEGIEMLEVYDIRLIIVTMGANGCYVHTRAGDAHVPAMHVKAMDTTGAGDAFMSGILYSISIADAEVDKLRIKDVAKMAEFASISGALAASTKGAMTALPTLGEVNSHLK